MRILIVDDSKAMRQIVRRALRQAGYGDQAIDEVDSATAALEGILVNPPDLVLCDWNMPAMTGIDLLTTLRSSGSTVKLGFVTSEGSEPIRLQAQSAGAAFLVTKPFSADDLRSAIGKAMS
jgi:two-component system, chemotaxis family, chemotaxis protein CheY